MLKRNKFVWTGFVMAAASVLDVVGVTEARAGVDGGNGGGAWVCQDSNALGTIRWATLVDLYEAKVEFGLKIPQYLNLKYDEIIDQVMVRRIFPVSQDLYQSIQDELEIVKSNMVEVNADLEIVEDSLYRIKPRVQECMGGLLSYTQLANYTNYGKILIQKGLFNDPRLSEVDKAALLIHEAVYAYRRKTAQDLNSVIARRIVGLVFSTLSTEDLKSALQDLGESETGAVGMKFVPIRPGNFVMGSPDNEAGRDTDEKQHLVTITRGFEMQNTEVTQSQWVKIMGSNPSAFQKYENCPKTYKVVKSIAMCPNHPVEQVNWNDVQVFLSKLNSSHSSLHRDGYFYRLPTEAEWEYAARAGNQSAYSFGNDPSQLFMYGYFASNSGNQTQDAGELKPNGLGLYDMHGNVWEWVSDWYVADNTGLNVDPVGPAGGSYRVVRGGSWNFDARSMRSANRDGSNPGYRGSYVGFRLVRTR